MSDEDRSDIEQPMQLKQLNLNELSKLLWIKLTRKDVDALTKDVVDNLDSKNYKTTVLSVVMNMIWKMRKVFCWK